MCGIAGVAGVKPGLDVLARMAAEMVHRGPDDQGTWAADGVGLCFRRLAVIDLHVRSNQPLHFEGLHLVFNGEIYNYLELREQLRRLGHRFQTEGDAEVLLHAFRQWGEGALDRFNGMFAFAIWDEDRRRLTMATDPFAEKPLFYSHDGARLLFASDVRALRTAKPELGRPAWETIATFLALGTMPVLPATFFADVFRLPPAHVGRWESGRLQLRRYWTPQRVEVSSAPAAVAEDLRHLLCDSVRLRLRSDVPVGTSLSGGVDSSGIVGLVAELAPERDRHAFTASFPGFERDEWRHAEAVIRRVGIIHHQPGLIHHHAVLPTSEDLLEDLQALVLDQEEPFGGTSIYAQWRVMRAARESGVVVMIDGQGADELFGGYAGVAGAALRSGGARVALRALAGDPRLVRELAVAWLMDGGPPRLKRAARMRWVSPYIEPGLARFAVGQDRPSTNHAGESPLRRELLAQAFQTSLPNLLRYADRDSMAHSVEVRLPFLDRRIAELAFSLPAQWLYFDRITKRTLRQALRGLVSDSVLDRTDKVGFETPQRRWLNAPALRSRLGELLLDSSVRSSGRYDLAVLERDLRRGAWSDVDAIWRMASVELWLRSLAPPMCPL